MSSSTTPTYTASAAGNIHTSASLAASATANDNYDGSAVFETQVHVLNTPSGSVAATRGLKVEVFRRYGTTPTTGQTAFLTYTLPSTTASTAESLDFYLPTGQYNIKITNLDASNAVTVEITGDKVTALATA